MKIISKQQDYYDFAGQVSDVVYVRKEAQTYIWIDKSLLAKIQARETHSTYNNGLNMLFFSIWGSPYFLWEIGKSSEPKSYCFSDEELTSFYSCRKFKKKYFQKNLSLPTREEFIKMHKKLKTPIFVYNFNKHYETTKDNYQIAQICVDTNVILKNYGFAAVLPAHDLFQQIEFFISNDLAEPKPMIEISDKNRIAGHGFDEKSFRKPKSK